MTSYVADFRGLPSCPCQREWLPIFEAEAQRRGFLVGPLPLSQIIGGADSSGNTHLTGGADDTYPLTAVLDVYGYVWLSRQMGADPTWLRPQNWDGNNGVRHVHRVLRGCTHLSDAAQVQVACVDRNDDGLVGDALDTGPRPLSGRTWREGIKWAEEQDVTPEQADQLDRIEAKLDDLDKVLSRITKSKREILAAVEDEK